MINLIAMPKTISSRTSAYIPYLGGGLAAVVMAALLYVGVFYHRQASAQDYPVQGFDLSHHQGDIQWSKISPEKFQFVYLKATEGGDFKDSKFQDNWLKAHNFIETVPKKLDALPPVIDLEYDSNCIHTYTREQLLQEIKVMHDLLAQHYAKQPIFYVSKTFYHIVLMGNFKDTPLWIRDYQEKPQLKDQRDWMFWQHTNQGHIQGIVKPVDLNVFSGSQRQWQNFIEQNKQAPKP